MRFGFTRTRHIIRHVNTVRNSRNGNAEFEAAQIPSFSLSGRNMTLSLRQIASLIQPPRNSLLRLFVPEGPRLEHSSNTHYTGDPVLRRQHRKSMVMWEPNSVVMEKISGSKPRKCFRFCSHQTLDRSILWKCLGPTSRTICCPQTYFNSGVRQCSRQPRDRNGGTAIRREETGCGEQDLHNSWAILVLRGLAWLFTQ